MSSAPVHHGTTRHRCYLGTCLGTSLSRIVYILPLVRATSMPSDTPSAAPRPYCAQHARLTRLGSRRHAATTPLISPLHRHECSTSACTAFPLWNKRRENWATWKLWKFQNKTKNTEKNSIDLKFMSGSCNQAQILYSCILVFIPVEFFFMLF
jgi:hypothetical protein